MRPRDEVGVNPQGEITLAVSHRQHHHLQATDRRSTDRGVAAAFVNDRADLSVADSQGRRNILRLYDGLVGHFAKGIVWFDGGGFA